MRHRNGFEGDWAAGGRRDPIGILDQPPGHRSADVTEAEQANPIGRAHSGTLPSPP
jgi:hypothetical protein